MYLYARNRMATRISKMQTHYRIIHHYDGRKLEKNLTRKFPKKIRIVEA